VGIIRSCAAREAKHGHSQIRRQNGIREEAKKVIQKKRDTK
jgi:hypothetical protein